jgi:hypothetical protein
MDADDSYLAGPPPLRRLPVPVEPLWSLRKSGRQVDCVLRFHGESYGWECQFLHNGELSFGQRFVLRRAALREAETQRQRLIADGWATL